MHCGRAEDVSAFPIVELSPVKVQRLFWPQSFRFCHKVPGIAIGSSCRFGAGEVGAWRTLRSRREVVEVELTF
jgi:hypothetical protein